MASRGAPPIISLILVLSLALHLQAQGPKPPASAEEFVVLVPVKTVVYRPPPSALPAAATTAAVSYEPFELCQGCRCCSSSNASSCVDTSCCYAIDCNLPGKPFGTCAFTPLTCGCAAATAAAGNCTQPS